MFAFCQEIKKVTLSIWLCKKNPDARYANPEDRLFASRTFGYAAMTKDAAQRSRWTFREVIKFCLAFLAAAFIRDVWWLILYALSAKTRLISMICARISLNLQSTF